MAAALSILLQGCITNLFEAPITLRISSKAESAALLFEKLFPPSWAHKVNPSILCSEFCPSAFKKNYEMINVDITFFLNILFC